LIHKTKTQYGNLKFYTERVANSKDSIARVYAAVDSNGYKIYYNFYPNSIVKTAETEKQISYTVYYGKLSENYNKNIYVKFNSIDSLVLSQGDILIDLFQYNNIKKSKGAEAYITEIVYYHGWPKHKDFKP
jgi:hypothetical protein